MSKMSVGLLLGAVLGVLDGLTAWFTPDVRDQLAGIVMGSVFKDALAGLAVALFARKVRSVPAGIVFGMAAGALLSYLVAAAQGKHYFEIMLPGSLVGIVLGYATQRSGAVKILTAQRG